MALIGLQQSLAQPDIEILGTAGDWSEVLAAIRVQDPMPQVILLDGGITKGDFVDSLREIRTLAPEARVVLYCAPENSDEDVVGGVIAGAVGVVSRYSHPEEIAEQIRDAARCTVQDTGEARRRRHELLAALLRPPEPIPWPLNRRDRICLDCLARGYNHGEIAEVLEVDPETARFHLKNLFKKMEVTNKTQAVVKAIAAGVIHATM